MPDQLSEPLSGFNDSQCRQLFDRTFTGMVFCKMIYEGEKPVDFIYLAVNKAFEALTGKRDLAGKKASEAFPELRTSYPEVIEIYGRVARSGNPERFERYFENMDIWFAVTAYGNGPGHFVAVYEDINERKNAEIELRNHETQLSNALAIAQAGAWEYDVANDTFFFNDNFYRIFGVTAQEVGGYTMSAADYAARFCHPEDAPMVGAEVAKSIATTDPNFSQYIEHRVIFGNGQPGHIAVRICVVKDKEGRTIRTYGVNQNITERKRQEEEKRKLEEQVQKGARLESLGLLAGGIAHDFNNLLSGIFGYLELAREYAAPGMCQEYMGKALKTFVRAKDLTLQLLTFSKGGTPCMKTGSPAALLGDATRFAMSGSAISPEFSIANELWQCDFDENQITQVIDNILFNAVQAMPNGGSLFIAAENVHIHKGENPALAEGKYVRISFKDTGVGMPTNILPRIFDPFFTTKQQGNGLGLAIAYSIMKKHRGDIVVESELGTGSTFHLFLPASEKELLLGSAAGNATHHGSGRILIMDDEQCIREIVSAMLGRMGYDTEVAGNGLEAINLLHLAAETKSPFRAAIMDLTIPGGMGGKEAIRKIRETDNALIVFVSSGYSEDPVMADPTAFGFTDKIHKPFMRTELEKVLEKHLTKA